MAYIEAPSIKVETNSLKSSIAYGMSTLGAIPLRYNKPRFISLRRRFQEDMQEERLLKLNNGRLPDIFALCSFTSIGKPATIQGGNPSALRTGVNLASSTGQNFRLSGTYVEIAITANIYAERIDDLLAWMASVVTLPSISGRCELTDDGRGFNIKVNIDPRMDWVDPVGLSETTDRAVDRMYSTTVNVTVVTMAASITSAPLFKTQIKHLDMGDGDIT